MFYPLQDSLLLVKKMKILLEYIFNIKTGAAGINMMPEMKQQKTIMIEYWILSMISLLLLLLKVVRMSEKGIMMILIGKKVKVTPPMYLSQLILFFSLIIVNLLQASRLTHTVWYLLMNMAARRDIKSILNKYMKAKMYISPLGLVHSLKSMLPLKALNISIKA